MMNKVEAALYLAGVKTTTEDRQASAPTNLHIITGEISGESEDGKALISIDGLVFAEDDEQYIEVDTLGGLEDGDVATVILSGEEGRGMTPLAIGGVGTIDRINLRVKEIEADYIKTEELEAAEARIGDLEADTADIDAIRANSAKVANLTAEELEADHATVGQLDANYAKLDATNIGTATIQAAWIDQLLVQSGLLAHEGTIFSLDAVQVNAASIKAGTIDVERILVTGQDGEKYLVHVEGGQTNYEKLDGNVIEDLTITADKIVANAITADKITTNNIVGTGGWINLHSGTFAYTNAQTGQGIAWDGSNLSISGSVTIGQSSVTLTQIAEQASTALDTALDGAFLVLTSTNGQLFKNGSESTILQVAVFPNGGDRCDTLTQVRARFGSSAYIEWKWMHESSGEWGTLLSTDSHLSHDGMWLTVTPDDVATKTTFAASLVVPD